MSKTSVAVVIPAYNEAKMVGRVIDDVRHAFAGSDYRVEIIVVDDGSTDATAAVAKNHGAFVIQHIINMGSGSATATGLSYAQQHDFTVAATLDADGQHAAHDVLTGVDELLAGTSDLLIGSRLLGDGNMSLTKTVGNKGLTLAALVLFGVRITDSQSGLRIFSRRALEALRWKSSGYEYCSEMLWRAKQLGLTIHEYPIKAIYSEYSTSKSTRQNNWNGFNIITSLMRRRIFELFHE